MSKKNRAAQIEERRIKVSANLLAGLTYRQMGKALDVSIGTIAKDVKIILGRMQKEQIVNAEDWVTLELSRIDRAMNAIWGQITDSDSKTRLHAIDRMVKLMELRSKYLGLFMPEKHALTDPEGKPLDLDKFIEQQLEDLAASQQS